MTFGIGLMVCGFGAAVVLAGEASSSANAATGWGRTSGTAGATANWSGGEGTGFAKTRTQTGEVNLARGLAFGFDEDGLDLSFSHAIAPQFGPAYAGTFNLSIGLDGQVKGAYGGVLSKGGLTRQVEAGGATGSNGRPAVAMARGDASPTGVVHARTQSYTSRPTVYRVTRVPMGRR